MKCDEIESQPIEFRFKLIFVECCGFESSMSPLPCRPWKEMSSLLFNLPHPNTTGPDSQIV